MVTLFRRDPLLALECACWIEGRVPPSAEQVAIIDRSESLPRPSLTTVTDADTSGDVRCDVLLTVHRRHRDGLIGEAIEVIWIVEVQLARDLSRAQAWCDAIVAAARMFGLFPADVHMLVICPDPRTRDWMRRRLFPRMKFRPSLLTRAHMPRLHDAGLVAGRPEPAVLSAVIHGREPRNLAVVRTALSAIAPLELSEPNIHREYIHVLGKATGQAMTDQLPSLHEQTHEFEADLDDDDDVPRWEFEGMTWGMIRQRLTERSLERGLEQGLVQARREALLAMLALAELIPTPGEQATIARCDDPARLATWMARVRGANQVAEVLAPAP